MKAGEEWTYKENIILDPVVKLMSCSFLFSNGTVKIKKIFKDIVYFGDKSKETTLPRKIFVEFFEKKRIA